LGPASSAPGALCRHAFFLEGLEAASLRQVVHGKAAQATLVGDVFDDAATGQGLLNYFLRAINCGAITLDEIKATGFTLGKFKLIVLEDSRWSHQLRRSSN
jgi:hypothetical protein